MFYFLDATHAPTLCRLCLASIERGRSPAPRAPFRAPAPSAVVPPAAEALSEQLGHSPSSRGRYYPFFEEYLAEVDAGLEELPQHAPFVLVARQLRSAAIRLWEGGEAFRGLLVLRRLWSRLRELDLLPPPQPPGTTGADAPWSEIDLPESPQSPGVTSSAPDTVDPSLLASAPTPAPPGAVAAAGGEGPRVTPRSVEAYGRVGRTAYPADREAPSVTAPPGPAGGAP